MNVPLKKRYNNYSAITKISAISTNTPFSTNQLEAVSGAGGDAVTAAISTTLYQHRENNNVNRQNIKPFDIDNVPDKSVNSTPATMPASTNNMQVNQQPPSFGFHSGDILNATAPANFAPGAMSPRSSESSAAANTSSSSMKSGGDHGNGDNAAGSGENTGANGNLNLSNNIKSGMYLPMRDTISLRHQNKHLNEVNVKISELENPAMTTKDRVLNWMVAEVFSDIEDDIDLEDGKCISAFRSERLQIKSYNKNHPTLTKTTTAKPRGRPRAKTISSSRASLTKAAKRAKSVIYKPFKLFLSEEYKPPSVDNSNCSEPSGIQMRKIAKKRGYQHDARTTITSLPKKRILFRQLSNDDLPSISDRLDASIKLRIDYGKSLTDNFKIPGAPVARTVHNHYPPVRYVHFDRMSEVNHRLPSSMLRDAPHSAARNQEEFYKYLGIDTNPCHGKQSPEAENSSTSNNRRSLRVKIQQKVVKNIAKSNEAARDDVSQKSGKRRSGVRLDDSASTISNGNTYGGASLSSYYMGPLNQSEITSENYILSDLSQEPEVTARIDIRYSYQKQSNSTVKRSEATKSIAAAAPAIKTEADGSTGAANNIGGANIKEERTEAPPTSAAIVDRRFYEPIDSETSAQTYPFLLAETDGDVEIIDDKSQVQSTMNSMVDSSNDAVIDLTSEPEDEGNGAANNHASNNGLQNGKDLDDKQLTLQAIEEIQQQQEIVSLPAAETPSQPAAETPSPRIRNAGPRNRTVIRRKLGRRRSVDDWVRRYDNMLHKSAILKMRILKKNRMMKLERQKALRKSLLVLAAAPATVAAPAVTESAAATDVLVEESEEEEEVTNLDPVPSTSKATSSRQSVPFTPATEVDTILMEPVAPPQTFTASHGNGTNDLDRIISDHLSSLSMPSRRLTSMLPSLVTSMEPAPSVIDPLPPQTLLQPAPHHHSSTSPTLLDIDPQPSTSTAHITSNSHASQDFMSRTNDEYLEIPDTELPSPLLSPIGAGHHSSVFNDKPFSAIAHAHSSTSSDSAIGIAINAQFERMAGTPTASISMPTASIMQETDALALVQSPGKNPLRPEHGAVLAALVVTTHNHNDIIVAIQEVAVSFWKMAPKFFNVFGIVQSCEMMGRVARSVTDKEIMVPYQNRIMVGLDKLPVYVEFRGRDLHNNDSRECWLTSIFANIYFLSDIDGERLSFLSIQLDTIKSPIECITYVTIPNTMFIAMAWTEHFLANKKRATVCKYGLRYPELDALHSITDFVAIQDTINTLSCVGDQKLAGYGLKTFTMWDHRTGDLLINLNLNAHIGINLGCFSLENVEYIFLVQFFKKTEAEADQHSIKLIAISTESYKWQTLQLHEIPVHYDTIASTHISTEHLIVTFTNGHSLLMNLQLPQHIYLCDPPSDDHALLPTTNGRNNGVSPSSSSSSYQVFVCNGKILQLSPEHLVTRSIVEHFLSSMHK